MGNKKIWRVIPEGAALPLGVMFGVTVAGMGVLELALGMQDLLGFLVRTAVGAVSLWAALYIWRSRYRVEIDLLSVKGWQLTMAAFAGIELVRLLFNVPHFKSFSVAGGAFWLVWYVAFTGVLEELWWRGVWFAVWRGRPFMCVVAGSLLFGAMHIVQNDLGSVLSIAAIGALLGAARYRGASVGALAITHGALNWFNITVLGWNDRALPVLSGREATALHLVLCAAIAWAIYRLGPAKSAPEEAKGRFYEGN